jgi:hypothetical protein
MTVVVQRERATAANWARLDMSYVLWQVSTKPHPSAIALTEWKDYTAEQNFALETAFNDNCVAITFGAAGEIDPHTQEPHGDWCVNFMLMHQTNTVTKQKRLVRPMTVMGVAAEV